MPHNIEHNRIVAMDEFACTVVSFESHVANQKVRVPLRLLELVLEGELEVDDVPARDLVFRALLSCWLDRAEIPETEFK